MSTIYIIEDQMHAEWLGKYDSLSLAIKELRHLSSLPFGTAPNRCPCSNSTNCCREYQVIEYNAESEPWLELRRFGTLEINRGGASWLVDFKDGVLIENA